jgi:hypothetical protein
LNAGHVYTYNCTWNTTLRGGKPAITDDSAISIHRPSITGAQSGHQGSDNQHDTNKPPTQQNRVYTGTYTRVQSIAHQTIHFGLSSFSYLSGVGTTCFHHVVIKIWQLFLRPAACLTSTLLETGVGTNNYKCSRDQRLNMPSEARR